MLNVSLLFLIVILVVTPTEARIQSLDGNVIQRINYGVIFKEESSLVLANEYWLHTFKIPLPKRFIVPKMSQCNQSNENCAYFENLSKFIHELHSELFTHFNKTMRAIKFLIPQIRVGTSKGRQTRAILSFVGSLSRSLFGTATMDDVNILASHINALVRKTNSMSNALVQHGSHLSSFMSLADQRMTNLKKGIKNNAEEIQLLADKIQNAFSSLANSFTNVSEVLLRQVHKVTIFRTKLDQLDAAVQSLVDGKITPFFISKSTMLTTIAHIDQLLRKSHHDFYLIHKNPNYYYANGEFFFTRHQSTIFLTLKFPISAQQHPMKLFKIISLPVPAANNRSSQHATQLMSLPDYFAMSDHEDYYVQLKAGDLVNCKKGQLIVCQNNWALSPISKPSCVLSLFNNDNKLVHKLCDFRFRPHVLQPQIVELSSTSVLLYNTMKVTLNCPKQAKVVPGCMFCLLTIPCKCSVSTDDWYFPPRLVNCYNKNKQISTVHPVNLALLQEFFDESKLSHIFGNSMFPNPVNFSVPEFKFYNHSFNEFLVADAQSHLNLQKMAKAAKKDEKVFKSLAEPLLDGRIEIQPSEPSVDSILTYVSLGLAAISFGFGIILFCKYRKLSIAFTVLQQIQNVKSQTLPSFIYKATEVTEIPESAFESWFKSELTWAHASVMLSVLLIIILGVALLIMFKTKSCGTYIAVELTSGGHCVFVPLMHLSLCPSNYQVQIPKIQDVAVSGCLFGKLSFLWNKFSIIDKRTDKEMSVPSFTSLHPYTLHRIKNFLAQPFSANVVLIHQKYAYVLPRPAEQQFRPLLPIP